MTKTSEENRGMNAAVALLLIPVVVVLSGKVTSDIWNWHIVPWTHWQSLNVRTAIGISAFIDLIRFSPSRQTNDNTPVAIQFLSIYAALLFWAIAYVAR